MTPLQKHKIKVQLKRLTTLLAESDKMLVRKGRSRPIRESSHDEEDDPQAAVLDVGYNIIDSLPREDREEYVWDGGKEPDGSVIMYAYARFSDSAEMKKLVRKAVSKIKRMPHVTNVNVEYERDNDEKLEMYTIVVSFDT